ncbi:hypothetical protein P7H16_13920 [Paenibacillus larvae]|nr:hypothetical protein [Paenibacillus larvae]MDT2247794.1 hypothetical protein [Paenibacillus larvae]
MENALAKKLAEILWLTTYTLTLVRHADWYQAIQELHAEKGYAVTKLCKLAESLDLPIIKWLRAGNHSSGNLKSFHWPRSETSL